MPKQAGGLQLKVAFAAAPRAVARTPTAAGALSAGGGDSTAMSVGVLSVSLCVPHIRADQGALCDSSGLENKGNP